MYDEDDESFRCEGCGTVIPAFIDACPYCEEEDATAFCPECGAEVHVESQHCLACDAYITPSAGRITKRAGARGTLIIILLIFALLTVWVALR